MSFSVPRCRRPIWGSTRSTTSPSSSSTSRNTPCAAGCCGPKLMVKVRAAASAISLFAIPYSLFALLRLLVARQHVVRPLPGGQEIEIAELQRQPHRIVDHALLLL